MSEYLTVQAVALLLLVNADTVKRFIHRGILPAVKIGKSYRIKREAVENLLITGTTKAEKSN